MRIDAKDLEKAFAAHGRKHGGSRQDYFAPLYLAREFGLPMERALTQSALGRSLEGVDAFHLDAGKRNLHLFQFRWASTHQAFKSSFERLVNVGIEQLFSSQRAATPFLRRLQSTLFEHASLVDRIIVTLVFNGDPASAEKSPVLDSLREDLERKKPKLDRFFGGRSISLGTRFVSNAQHEAGGIAHTHATHTFQLSVDGTTSTRGRDGQVLLVGLVRLMDLHRMHVAMEERFFERNIRYGLDAESSPNRALRNALKRVADGGDAPETFAFHHNGVALSAESTTLEGQTLTLAEPRLLNGAQTVTTLRRFLRATSLDKAALARLEAIKVVAKVIQGATRDFVTEVTVNNNRQNPVEPWNLRANDLIQLEFQEKFLEAKLYYERQENAFQALRDEELSQWEIQDDRAIEMLPLARTFLTLQGDLDRMGKLREVFDQPKLDEDTFRPAYLKADTPTLLLCYKVQWRLSRLIKEIQDRGEQKYAYMGRARNLVWALLCQAILNSPELDKLRERFGQGLVMESDYTQWLCDQASTRIRFVISDAVEAGGHQDALAQGRTGFLRTRSFYAACMASAQQRYGWTPRRL